MAKKFTLSVILYTQHAQQLETAQLVGKWIYRVGQKQVYSCEYAKHRAYTCIIIY